MKLFQVLLSICGIIMLISTKSARFTPRRLRISTTAAPRWQEYWDEQPWESVRSFWKGAVCAQTDDDLPAFLKGGEAGTGAGGGYGVTDLGALHEAGHREYVSGDNRFDKQRNYAATVRYVGAEYAGYARQPALRTVEQDLRDALDDQLTSRLTVAGRTDRGVSAFAQVVNFQSAKASGLCAADFLETLHAAPGCGAGRLRVLDCRRVPKKFNARSQATWRRYVYLFPLKDGQDVNVQALGRVLASLEDVELGYHAFSYGECRMGGEGKQDLCTLYRARASIVSLRRRGGMHAGEGETDRAVCIELVGNRFLRRMVRVLCATALREVLLPLEEDRNEKCLLDILASQDRTAAAPPLPPHGLALCGVGYNVSDLAVYSTLPTNAAKLDALDERVLLLLDQKRQGTWVE